MPPKRKHVHSPPSSSLVDDTSFNPPSRDIHSDSVENNNNNNNNNKEGRLTETPPPRKVIKAGSGKLSELASLSSPASIGSSVETQGRLRKKYRLEKYYEELAILNRSFVAYCREAKHNILYKLENGLEILSQDIDFVEEMQQYMDHAAKIKKRWIPNTGDVLSFGTNEFGILAQADDVEERKRPCVITTLRNRDIVQVACGGLNTVVVSEDGQVYTWGCNDDGSLGCLRAGETAYVPFNVSGFVPSARETAVGLQRPKFTWSDFRGLPNFMDPMLELAPKYEEMIVSVAAGDCHCLALSMTGRVYFFGAYKCKEGMRWCDVSPEDDPRVHPKEENRMRQPPRGKKDWPIHVWQLGGEAIQIDCCYSTCAAVVKRTVNGIPRQECFTWGLGECGELARPVFNPIKKTKEEISLIPDEELEKSSYLKFHVDKIQDEYMKPGPALFADGIQDRIVEQVVCGGYHILVLARDSEDAPCDLYSAGLNQYGQLGPHDDGDNPESESRKYKDRLHKIVFPDDDMEIKKVAAGEHFSLCLDSTGKKLYGFGRGDAGQLGYSESAPPAGFFTTEPVPIYLEYNADGTPKENPVIREIACGGSHSFALTKDGTLYSWGYGPSGALGVGVIGDNQDCVFRPMKVDVTNGVNRLKQRSGEPPVSAAVQMVAGGGQHSVMVATLH